MNARQMKCRAVDRHSGERVGLSPGSALSGTSSVRGRYAGQAYLRGRGPPVRVSERGLEVSTTAHGGASPHDGVRRARPPFRVSPPKYINPPARTITGLRPRTWERETDPFENVRKADRMLERACRKLVEQQQREAVVKAAARARLRAQKPPEVGREARHRVQLARTTQRQQVVIAVEHDVLRHEEVSIADSVMHNQAGQNFEAVRRDTLSPPLSRPESTEFVAAKEEQEGKLAASTTSELVAGSVDDCRPHVLPSGVKKTICIQTDVAPLPQASALETVQRRRFPPAASKCFVTTAVQADTLPKLEMSDARETRDASPTSSPLSSTTTSLSSSSSSSPTATSSSSSSSSWSTSSSLPSGNSGRYAPSNIRKELEVFREQLVLGLRERHIRQRQEAKYRALLSRLSDLGLPPTAGLRKAADVDKVLRFDATVQVNEETLPHIFEPHREASRDTHYLPRSTTQEVVVYKCECVARHTEGKDNEQAAGEKILSTHPCPSMLERTSGLGRRSLEMQSDDIDEVLRQNRQLSSHQGQEVPPSSSLVGADESLTARILSTHVLPENVVDDVLQGRDRLWEFLEGEEGVDVGEIENSGEAAIKPWDVVASIANDLVDEMLAQCAPEIERVIDEFVETMIEAEILPKPAPPRPVEVQ